MITEDFEIDLIEWAQEQIGKPFAWGATDCMTLAVQAVDVILGAEYAGDVIDAYSDEAGAKAYLEKTDPVEFLMAAGFTEINLAFARVGDIVLASAPDFPHCAHVCLGSRVLSVAPGKYVTTYPKRLLAKTSDVTAWRAE